MNQITTIFLINRFVIERRGILVHCAYNRSYRVLFVNFIFSDRSSNKNEWFFVKRIITFEALYSPWVTLNKFNIKNTPVLEASCYIILPRTLPVFFYRLSEIMNWEDILYLIVISSYSENEYLNNLLFSLSLKANNSINSNHEIIKNRVFVV